MNLSPETIAKKKIELEEALAQREATERGQGDRISISLSAADRTVPLSLEPPAVAAVEEEDPKPAPVDGPSDANVQRALLRVLEGDPEGWHGEGELFAAVAESFPAECRPGYSQLSRMLTDLQRAGRVEIGSETEGETPSRKVIPRATKKAPKKKGKR